MVTPKRGKAKSQLLTQICHAQTAKTRENKYKKIGNNSKKMFKKICIAKSKREWNKVHRVQMRRARDTKTDRPPKTFSFACLLCRRRINSFDDNQSTTQNQSSERENEPESRTYKEWDRLKKYVQEGVKVDAYLRLICQRQQQKQRPHQFQRPRPSQPKIEPLTAVCGRRK